MAKTILHVVPSENYFKGVVAILRKIKQKQIIYVTTNKPYQYLTNILKKNKLSPERMFFIDCISKQLGEKIEKEPANCIFIESPQSLTTIGIAINQSLKSIKGTKVVFFDSLSIMLLYNDANTLGKFSNFLINRLRSFEQDHVDTILLVLESDIDKTVIKQVESVVDEVVKRR